MVAWVSGTFPPRAAVCPEAAVCERGDIVHAATRQMGVHLPMQTHTLTRSVFPAPRLSTCSPVPAFSVFSCSSFAGATALPADPAPPYTLSDVAVANCIFFF